MPNCARCGKPFSAVRSDAKYCSSTCRSAKFRGGPDPDLPPSGPDVLTVADITSDLVTAVENELLAAGVLATAAGQAALMLARIASNPAATDGPRVTAARQVAGAVAAAIASGAKGKSRMDEIKAKREAKEHAAGGS